MTKELTAREHKFIDSYLKSHNATKAVVEAGFTCKYPDRYGNNLLHKPVIKEAIDKTRNKLMKKTEIDREWVLHKLKLAVVRSIPDGDEPPMYHPAVGLAALKQISEILGFKMPERRINMSIDATIESIRNARLEYKKEY